MIYTYIYIVGGMIDVYEYCILFGRVSRVQISNTHTRVNPNPLNRRIHQGYFRDVFPTVISALGLPLRLG